jgi:flagellar protein FliL
MSTAAAATAEAPPPKKGKKKLIIILAAVLTLVLAGGGGAVFMLKKKASADEEGDEAVASETDTKASAKDAPKRDAKTPPAYVPLEVFTVNLADRDVERYAQVGITLELLEAKDADKLKLFMPAIRNNILMVLSHKTSQELLEREGKTKLAQEVQRAASRALGVEVREPDAEAAAADDEDKPKKKGQNGDKGAKKAKKPVEAPLPILAVHFSNFTVQ